MRWFYLTFERRCKIEEGNILFNDALNTFYLQLYGIRNMVKDHSVSEKGNPLLPHRLLFQISSKGSFICIIPQITHTLAFVIPVREQWLERGKSEVSVLVFINYICVIPGVRT